MPKGKAKSGKEGEKRGDDASTLAASKATPSENAEPQKGVDEDEHRLSSSQAKKKKKPSKASKREKRQKKGSKSSPEEEEEEELKIETRKNKEEEKKVYDLPGQTHDTPDERDPLRIFFETLYRKLPDNELAATWMMEWGLLPLAEATRIHEKLQMNLQQKLELPAEAAPIEKTLNRLDKKKGKISSETVLKTKKRKHIDDNSHGSLDDPVSRIKKIKKLKVSA